MKEVTFLDYSEDPGSSDAVLGMTDLGNIIAMGPSVPTTASPCVQSIWVQLHSVGLHVPMVRRLEASLLTDDDVAPWRRLAESPDTTETVTGTSNGGKPVPFITPTVTTMRTFLSTSDVVHVALDITDRAPNVKQRDEGSTTQAQLDQAELLGARVFDKAFVDAAMYQIVGQAGALLSHTDPGKRPSSKSITVAMLLLGDGSHVDNTFGNTRADRESFLASLLSVSSWNPTWSSLPQSSSVTNTLNKLSSAYNTIKAFEMPRTLIRISNSIIDTDDPSGVGRITTVHDNYIELAVQVDVKFTGIGEQSLDDAIDNVAEANIEMTIPIVDGDTPVIKIPLNRHALYNQWKTSGPTTSYIGNVYNFYSHKGAKEYLRELGISSTTHARRGRVSWNITDVKEECPTLCTTSEMYYTVVSVTDVGFVCLTFSGLGATSRQTYAAKEIKAEVLDTSSSSDKLAYPGLFTLPAPSDATPPGIYTGDNSVYKNFVDFHGGFVPDQSVWVCK
jgi:hypothetical protein